MWNSILESIRKGENISDETKDDIVRDFDKLLRFRRYKVPVLLSRYEPMFMRFIKLNDGQNICPSCHSLAVLDSKKANVVFKKVHEFYEDMKIGVDKNIPFFLVDQTDLGEAYASGDVPKGTLIYGLTIHRKEIIVKRVTSSSLSGETMSKKAEKLRNKAMLVLYGFSVLNTGSILAHEMMHAWLGCEGAFELDTKLKEGICEVMGHKWIDWYDFKADKSFSYTSQQIQFLEKLKRSIKNSIEENRDKIYGDEFRDVNRAVERFGLRCTSKFIVRKALYC